MNTYKKIINFLNEFKKIFYQYDDGDFSEADKQYIENIKNVNPYGLFVMVFGGVSFAFGPQFVLFPIVTLLVSAITIGTFEREKEDNPWTFIVGMILSFIGLYMYLSGIVHELKL